MSDEERKLRWCAVGDSHTDCLKALDRALQGALDDIEALQRRVALSEDEVVREDPSTRVARLQAMLRELGAEPVELVCAVLVVAAVVVAIVVGVN